MLYRNKKENDLNKGKWIGVGGKFEEKESPEECLLREVKEETGLTLIEYKLRCLVTFVSDEWIDKDKIWNLNMWEGDRLFLEKIQQEKDFFTIKVEYKGDKLVK